MMRTYTSMAIAILVAAASYTSAFATDTDNTYRQAVFVANKQEYAPNLAVEKDLINAWGIAIRPAGMGGHFWITAKDTSYEYVGDVTQSPDTKLQTLHQDNLKIVKLPVGGADKFATSTVYSDSKKDFVITQQVKGAEPVTAAAKFLFASDGGIISAWTERKKADGTFDRAPVAEKVIDRSVEGSQFFGLALSSQYDRLYVADFGAEPAIRVYDGAFKPLPVVFDTPFDENKNGKVDTGEYAPFNITLLKTPENENHLFVSYAKTKPCSGEGLSKGECKAKQLWAGEEDTSAAGYGRLAEFTEEGKLVRIWSDNKKLSAPWGVAFAPANFGALSGRLLVANFGDGTIAAFDTKTHAFTNVMQTESGETLVIDKLWGIVFGNGASLGDANALYYTAGSNDEKDGLFGSIRFAGNHTGK